MKKIIAVVMLCLGSMLFAGCSNIPSMDKVTSFFSKPEKVSLSAEEIKNIKEKIKPETYEILKNKFQPSDEMIGQYFVQIDQQSQPNTQEKEKELQKKVEVEVKQFELLNHEKRTHIADAISGLKVRLVEQPRDKFTDKTDVDIVIENTASYFIKPEIYVKIKENVFGKTVYLDKISYDQINKSDSVSKKISVYGDKLSFEFCKVVPKELVSKGILFNDKVL